MKGNYGRISNTGVSCKSNCFTGCMLLMWLVTCCSCTFALAACSSMSVQSDEWCMYSTVSLSTLHTHCHVHAKSNTVRHTLRSCSPVTLQWHISCTMAYELQVLGQMVHSRTAFSDRSEPEQPRLFSGHICCDVSWSIVSQA